MSGITLVCGASGQIGSRVLKQLRERGVDARGMSRHKRPDPDQGFWVQADFGEPKSLRAALVGVDKVLLVSGDHPAQDEQEMAMLSACQAADVEFVVKLSAQSAGLSPPVSFGKQHHRIEQALINSGLGYTILRPMFFMQSIAFFASDIQSGRLIAPTGRGKVALVDADDVAESATRILLDPKQHNKATYELTGPVALSMGDVAGILSKHIGHSVKHISPPAPLAKLILPFISTMPRWQSNLAVELMRAIAQGAQSRPGNQFELICARQPGGFEDWAMRHRDIFSKPNPSMTT